MREGFDWAVAVLQSWMTEMKAVASRLKSPELMTYLGSREELQAKRQQEISAGFQSLSNLAVILSEAASSQAKERR